MIDATRDSQNLSENAEDEASLDPSDPIEVVDGGDSDTGGDAQTDDPACG